MIPSATAIAVLLFVTSTADPAHGATLQIDPLVSPWLHVLAAALLFLHIAGGAIGLFAGLVASVVKKGGSAHRVAGRCFFIAMFVAYLIGALVAPFLEEGQKPNFIAGILALYLLISGVMAARRRNFRAGRWEKIGLLVALLITAIGVLFAYQGANSETGTVDGSPSQAFYVFIIAGSVSAVEEIYALIYGKLSEVARKIRHLWRMCFSFFIATGSLFFGQPQVFFECFDGSLAQAVLASSPIIVMLFWLIVVSLRRSAVVSRYC